MLQEIFQELQKKFNLYYYSIKKDSTKGIHTKCKKKFKILSIYRFTLT